MKRIRIKRGIIYFLGILLILAIIYICFTYYQKYKNGKIIKEINYYNTDDSSYDVYYSGSQLVSGKSNQSGFIAKYTDKIDIDFDYKLNFSDSVKGNQESLVKATVVICAPNSETPIWKSDVDYLIPTKKVEYENVGQFKFKNRVSIDYKKYLGIYENFKKETSIVSNAKLLVEFVSSSIANDGVTPEIVKTDTITYDIPLSDVVYSINKKSTVSGDIKTSKSISKKTNLIYLLLLGILLIMFIIIVMIIIYLEDRYYNGYYKNKLNKILKSYDNIIVNIKEIPLLDGKNVIEVTKFEELLDAQMEMRLPINYCETIKNQESKFIIVTDDIAWVYILKRKKVNYEK